MGPDVERIDGRYTRPDTHGGDAQVSALAASHWGYVEGVLRAHGESDDVIAKCGHHYQAAFMHGWKHAKEDSAHAGAPPALPARRI
jgi:hypothetical protein